MTDKVVIDYDKILDDLTDVLKTLDVSKLAIITFNPEDYEYGTIKDRFGNVYGYEILQRTVRVQIRIFNYRYDNICNPTHTGYFEISVDNMSDVPKALAILFRNDLFQITPDYHKCPYSCIKGDEDE